MQRRFRQAKSLRFFSSRRPRTKLKTLQVILAVIMFGSPVSAQTGVPAPVLQKDEPSGYELLKAKRDKADADKKRDSLMRAPRWWDKDAEGKRPWERSDPSDYALFKAKRAKDDAEEKEKESLMHGARPWDRGADGRRP
jgi:hypothetical protein